jgi:hypothetical protein
MSPASTARPNSVAVPDEAGNSPVSIFIVVVLPQPLEPRKPKISPRSMRKLTWSTAVNSPKRRVRACASIAGGPRLRGRGGITSGRWSRRLSSGSSEMNACSRVALAVARLEFGRAAGGQHAAGVHCHQPVETLCLVHVGRCHEHAHRRPARADVPDEFPELAARQGIDAGGRLVEDQQLGVVNQRTAEPQFLLHAAGELAGRPLGERREAGAVQ